MTITKTANKYWIGDYDNFILFCETDLKVYYHIDFPHKMPNSEYCWDDALRSAHDKPQDHRKPIDYIKNLRYFFGDYFPELYEDLIDYE